MNHSQSKLKILVFIDAFMYPTLSFIYNELKEVAKTHQVKIVCTSRLYEEQFPFYDVEIIPFEETWLERRLNVFLPAYKISFTKKSKSFSLKINELIKSYQPDIIHGHFGNESVRLYDNIKANNRISFISFHGYDASMMLSNEAYVRKLNTYFNKNNFYSIHVSNYMKNELLERKVNVKQSFLNYYGINPDFYKPTFLSNNKKNKFIFLQIAALREKKGHIYTIKAFADFLSGEKFDPKYKLVLAGDGDLKIELIQLVESLGIKDFVEFKGLVNYDQCKELLNEADVFVHHSITSQYGDKEGVPNAIIEAMVMKLPIISTYHAGIPELVENNINGYLVKEKDVAEYVNAMKKIISWDKLDINRDKVVAKFSLENHTKNILNFYNQAIKNN